MKLLATIFLLFPLIIYSENKVYFINLEDGDELQSPFLVQFGLKGKGIAPAGIDIDNTGHHHLLINVDSIDYSLPIPSSSQHIHFGLGPVSYTHLTLPTILLV